MSLMSQQCLNDDMSNSDLQPIARDAAPDLLTDKNCSLFRYSSCFEIPLKPKIAGYYFASFRQQNTVSYFVN